MTREAAELTKGTGIETIFLPVRSRVYRIPTMYVPLRVPYLRNGGLERVRGYVVILYRIVFSSPTSPGTCQLGPWEVFTALGQIDT